MDTNDKIVGVIFNIDKAIYEKLISQGLDSNEAATKAAQTAMIFKQDPSKHEIVDFGSYADNAKETKIKQIHMKLNRDGGEKSSYFSGDPNIIDALDRAANHKEYVVKSKREETTEKAINKATNNLTKYVPAGVLAAVTVAALAACGGMNKDKEEEPEVKTTIEVQTKEQSVPSDWHEYEDMNLDNIQYDLFANGIYEWVNANGTEEWETVTFTQEELENISKNYQNLNIEGNKAVFGFTAEDAYSIALRFGRYTKYDYVTLTGGKEIDTVSIMDDSHSMSNGALFNISSYYLCSDKCDLDIEKVINFNEAEVAKINEIEEMLREFKNLDKEGKEKEAEEKMQEIKSWIYSYAQAADAEQENAKSYILRTFLPTFSTISQMHQYKDTIVVNLYDTKTSQNVTKEIKTDLFDEIMMRKLVLGFNESENIGAFDAESFLEEHNISNTRYNLLNTDVGSSIADQSCGAQSERLTEANEYIASLKNQDVTVEASFVGTNGIDLSGLGITIDDVNNVPTNYDKLTAGTYDSQLLIELIDNYLKANDKYPENLAYFTSYRISENQIEYKNTHGVTRGKPDDIIATEIKPQISVTPSDLKSETATTLNQAGQKVTADEAMAEAKQIDANESNDYSYVASTPEESKQAEQQATQDSVPYNIMLNNVYDVTYQYFYEGQASGYDSGWATSSDAQIVERHNTAKGDALNRKALDEQAAKFNAEQQSQNTVIDPEYKDAEIYETPQAPVESVDNTTKVPEVQETVVVPPAPDNSNTAVQPEIDYIPGFEDAEIVGDIIIGDTTNQTTTTFTATEEVPTVSSTEAAPVAEPAASAESTPEQYSLEDIENIVSNMTDEEWAEFESTGVLSTYDNSSQDEVKTR